MATVFYSANIPQALVLLALFGLTLHILRRVFTLHRKDPTKPTTSKMKNALREETLENPERVKAICDILLSANQDSRGTRGKHEYSIGIITALEEEFRAMIAMLDEEHKRPLDFMKSSDDSNNYVWGRIAQHNVVIVSFPFRVYGTNTAARVATLMVSAFPSIRMGLMVGIGGGVPSPNHDIRLGDIVVSSPGEGTTGGVVQYDFGKEEEGRFRRTGSLNKPPPALLGALTSFQARPRTKPLCEMVQHAFMAIYQAFETHEDKPTYAYQALENDLLFKTPQTRPGIRGWLSDFLTLSSGDSLRPVGRKKRLRPRTPMIHYGLIASGNRVMKNGKERDFIFASLKEDTNGGDCLCFEMEAAGLMDNFPCLVIRGISDYADSHKGHSWHGYASMTAAAFARELLYVLQPTDVESSKEAREIMGQIHQS